MKRLVSTGLLASLGFTFFGACSSDPNREFGRNGDTAGTASSGAGHTAAGTSNGGSAAHAGGRAGAAGEATTEESGSGGTAGEGGDSADAGEGGTGGTAGEAGDSSEAGHGGTAGSTSHGGSAGTLSGGSAGTLNGGGAGGGSGGKGGASQAGSGGQGGAPPVDHCLVGYSPDPSDDTIGNAPVEYTVQAQVDLTVQPEVIAWFQARVWQQANFQWHNIKRCSAGAATNDPLGGGINPCLSYPALVPANQEGKGPGDGLEFFALHRHLIQSMRQLWPKHAAQFEGWEHPPMQQPDVPTQWQTDWNDWNATTKANLIKADDPASHLTEAGFESEGAFGQWIQTTSGLNGALHFKWIRTKNTDHGLGNQFVYIDNYMFWKMQGWIDKLWDRYRAAQGKSPNDADIQNAVLAQCHQFDKLAVMLKPSLAGHQ